VFGVEGFKRIDFYRKVFKGIRLSRKKSQEKTPPTMKFQSKNANLAAYGGKSLPLNLFPPSWYYNRYGNESSKQLLLVKEPSDEDFNDELEEKRGRYTTMGFEKSNVRISRSKEGKALVLNTTKDTNPSGIFTIPWEAIERLKNGEQTFVSLSRIVGDMPASPAPQNTA